MFSMIWAALIFFFSTTRATSPAFAFFPYEDLVLHLLSYALFACLVFKAFRHSSNLNVAAMASLFAIFIPAVYGGAMELYQSLLPFRECSLADFAADAIGIVGTVLVIGKRNG